MRRSHAREKEWAFLPNFVGLSIPSRTYYSQTTSFAANLTSSPEPKGSNLHQ